MATKFRLLLLDADIIIETFGYGIWDNLIEFCGVYVSRIVANEAQFWMDDEGEKHYCDLDKYAALGKIQIVEAKPSDLSALLSYFDVTYRVLGRLHKGEQGISLEEVLQQVGLGRPLSKRACSKTYREHWTHMGAQDAIQGLGSTTDPAF